MKILKANNFDKCNHLIGCIRCGSIAIEEKEFDEKKFMKLAKKLKEDLDKVQED